MFAHVLTPYIILSSQDTYDEWWNMELVPKSHKNSSRVVGLHFVVMVGHVEKVMNKADGHTEYSYVIQERWKNSF